MLLFSNRTFLCTILYNLILPLNIHISPEIWWLERETLFMCCLFRWHLFIFRGVYITILYHFYRSTLWSSTRGFGGSLRSELPGQLSEWPKDGIQIPGFSGVFLPYGETAQDMAKVKLQFLHLWSPKIWKKTTWKKCSVQKWNLNGRSFFGGGVVCISLLCWFLSLFTCFNQVDECFFVAKPFVAKAHAHCGAALSCWHWDSM